MASEGNLRLRYDWRARKDEKRRSTVTCTISAAPFEGVPPGEEGAGGKLDVM